MFPATDTERTQMQRKQQQQIRERIARQTERADEALKALHRARNHDQRLAAAQALESAACQLRRALKAQS